MTSSLNKENHREKRRKTNIIGTKTFQETKHNIIRLFLHNICCTKLVEIGQFNNKTSSTS